MASIYARGNRLWCRVRDLHELGAWASIPTPFDVGDEARARRFATGLQRKIAAGARPLPPTLRGFATRWIEARRREGHDWRNDRARLDRHVLPQLGHLRLPDVRPPHLAEVFAALRGVLAARTVHNVYWVTAALFRDAVGQAVIDESPCRLDRRALGPILDADPRWREAAVFARDEAARLVGDPAIPADRQVAYGLSLLAGLRPGESAALRWAAYDARIRPLGQVTIARAYSSRGDLEKAPKTGVTRYVPVHPTLAAMLAAWRETGWPHMMGRAPKADDLMLPLPPAAAARRRARRGEAHRSTDYSGRRWREADLPALGWRPRPLYAMRATFISLALLDGADPHILETRVTHTPGSRAFAGYNRGRQWAQTCAEVAKLQLEAPGTRSRFPARAAGPLVPTVDFLFGRPPGGVLLPEVGETAATWLATAPWGSSVTWPRASGGQSDAGATPGPPWDGTSAEFPVGSGEVPVGMPERAPARAVGDDHRARALALAVLEGDELGAQGLARQLAAWPAGPSAAQLAFPGELWRAAWSVS